MRYKEAMCRIHALKILKQLGYVEKLDLWIPRQLKEITLTQCISISDSLLKHNETKPIYKKTDTWRRKVDSL